jgi:hypothetical protein
MTNNASTPKAANGTDFGTINTNTTLTWKMFRYTEEGGEKTALPENDWNGNSDRQE